MKNFEIKITKSTRYVDFENGNEKVGNIGENLQTMLVFSFTDEFVNGQARLEYTINGESQYVFMEKVGETYQTPVTSQLAQCGSIDLQLVITEGTDENEIPKFKSNVFYLPFGKSINAEVEQPEEYEEWIDIANTKLNEVDNLDIDMKDNIVTITKKDGSTISENVKGEKGDKGDAGSIKFIIVNELPTEDIDESAMYLKPNENPEEQNTYDEYVYTNGQWELLGNAKVEVDLTEYVKNTDYATSSKGGVIKLAKNSTVYLNENNELITRIATDYYRKNKSSAAVITPSTFDEMLAISISTNTKELTDEEKTSASNWLGLDGVVKDTDYATHIKGGVIKVSGAYGFGISSGNLTAQKLNKTQYDSANENTGISKGTLENVLNAKFVTLTQAEYTTLVSTGTVTTEDGITYTFDENTYYYIKEEE